MNILRSYSLPKILEPRFEGGQIDRSRRLKLESLVLLFAWLFVLHSWFKIKRSDYLTRSQGVSDVSDFSILLCLLIQLDFFRCWVSSNIIHFSTRARPLCPLMQLRLGPLATAHRTAWEKQDAEAELHPEQSKGSVGSKVQCWLSGQAILQIQIHLNSEEIHHLIHTQVAQQMHPSNLHQSAKSIGRMMLFVILTENILISFNCAAGHFELLQCFASNWGPDVPRSPRSVWPTPAGDQRPEVGLCFTLLLYLFCKN